MPADSSDSSLTALARLNLSAAELEALSTPFDTGKPVDLLLDDLTPTPAATAVPPAAKRAAPRVAAKAPRGGAGRAVLVVERSAIARKFLQMRLQAFGYVVAVADSGEHALEMIGRQAFAIVFLEIRLGPPDGIDGLLLCQTIKHRLVHPGGAVPAVVMVTGQPGSSDRVRGSLAGCDAYLTKPLLEADFVAALGEVDPLFK